MNANVNNLLDEFQKLPLDDKEYLAEIMLKQIREMKRESLVTRVSEARENYNHGKCKSGTLKDLMEDLEND